MGNKDNVTADSKRQITAKKRVKTVRRNRDKNVITAAITVMAERGYSATSIQEVADRVGVLKGSLYHYFSSKEELLFRILDESYQQSAEITREVVALNLSPLEELSEFLRRTCLWYLTNLERANIYFSESRHLTGDRLMETKVRGRDYEGYVLSLIVSAQNANQISSDIDPKLMTRFVVGALNNVRGWPSRSGKVFTEEEMANAFVQFTRRALGVST